MRMEKKQSVAPFDCRGTDDGTVRKTCGVNWGTSRYPLLSDRRTKTRLDEIDKPGGDTERGS